MKIKHNIKFGTQDLINLVSAGQTLIVTKTDEYLIVASESLKKQAKFEQGDSTSQKK